MTSTRLNINASAPYADNMQADNAAAPEQNDKAADTAFRYRRIVILALLLLAALSLFSFHPEDIDFYAGGIDASTYPRNLIGALGARTGWTLLVSLGLAAYPSLLLTILCSVRRLICRRGLRRSSWAYYAAIVLFALGCSFMFGLYPDSFSGITSALNIRMLAGGVIGQKFCQPGEGWLQLLMNTTGALLVSIAMAASALLIIWHYDWKRMTLVLLEGTLARWRQERELREQVADMAQDGGADAPFPGQERRAQGTGPLHVPAVGAPSDSPQLVTPTGQSFATRRGVAQQPAPAQQSAQNYMPRVPQQPPKPRHSELPQQPPAPEQQPAPPAPRPCAAGDTAGDDAGDSYTLPTISLFARPVSQGREVATHEEIEHNQRVIQDTLDQFNIDAEVVNAIPGPQVTLFEVQLGPGVLTNKLVGLQSNLSMALETPRLVRLLTPIPGKQFVGIEVANRHRLVVTANELFNDPAWQKNHDQIPLILGRNVSGECVVIDLAKAPHLLVAGSTGTGKSVCMNLMIQSILLKFPPEDLKLIMFDPKYLEFQPYSTLPHLITRIINEPQKVGLVLRWAITEMNRRYQLLAVARVRNLSEYNSRRPDTPDMLDTEGNPLPRKLPFIVIIIDELADIMATAKKEVDNALSILAAKSRAAGIHMIVATQRPDAQVVTGNLKNNFPWRVALQVTDAISSNVVMGCKGAEALLGKGDMLFKGNGELNRIQGGWVTNEEIASVVSVCSNQLPQTFDASLELALMGGDNADNNGGADAQDNGGTGSPSGAMGAAAGNGGDDLVSRAVEVLKTTKRATISNLQRRLRIGYNKAADLIQDLEDMGYVGPEPISGLREIYWDQLPGSTGYSGQIPAENQEDTDDGSGDDAPLADEATQTDGHDSDDAGDATTP